MKKIISFVLVLTLSIGLLISCDHEHSYSDDWTYDSDFHWHACTESDDCDEKGEKSAHDFAVIPNEDGKLINKCNVCGYSNEKVSTAPEHEHTYSDEYSYSENYHWHECTQDGCYVYEDIKDHQYGNPEMDYANQRLTITYTCVDCGYVKTESKTVNTEVDTSVEWDNIFGAFKLTNFSMNVYIGGKENPSSINHCVINESSVYYNNAGHMEFYVLKNEDGKYTGYMNSYKDGFIKMPEEYCENYFNNATRETVVQINFADNFDKFTYDPATGTYYAPEEIIALAYNFDATSTQRIRCYNSAVRIVDGKIASIECEYIFNEHTNQRNAFIYYNIGSSEVVVPESVIKEATAPGNKVDAEDLDILLYNYTEENTWSDITNSKPPVFDYVMWEPGCIFTELFEVANNSPLDINCDVYLVSEEELSRLTEVIEVYVLLGDETICYPTTRNPLESGYVYIGTLDDIINSDNAIIKGQILADQSQYFAIALKMVEWAGNEYQGLSPCDSIDVKIVATNIDKVEDTFGDGYDQGAN